VIVRDRLNGQVRRGVFGPSHSIARHTPVITDRELAALGREPAWHLAKEQSGSRVIWSKAQSDVRGAFVMQPFHQFNQHSQSARVFVALSTDQVLPLPCAGRVCECAYRVLQAHDAFNDAKTPHESKHPTVRRERSAPGSFDGRHLVSQCRHGIQKSRRPIQLEHLLELRVPYHPRHKTDVLPLLAQESVEQHVLECLVSNGPQARSARRGARGCGPPSRHCRARMRHVRLLRLAGPREKLTGGARRRFAWLISDLITIIIERTNALP
jgi:hypothetical protein